MLTESEKRAAVLAVSRYGADSSQVFSLVQLVLERRAQGEAADLLDLFERDKILDKSHIKELRSGLEKTQYDLTAKNGARPAGLRHEDVADEAPTDEGPEADPTLDIRALGDYRILRRLGEGGTGAVYLAYDEKQQIQVAIKVLSHTLAKSQHFLDRFYREAKSGALLNHPNIVRNLTVGQDQQTGVHYLVLEYVDGPSALDLLDKFGYLPVGDAVHIVLDVARALEHIHSRNVIHSDVKPGNILVTLSGLAKLADLGLAKRTDEASHLTHARQGFGTPYYMPYEQAMNAKYADGRSDIYALGGTFYHLLVGDVPFAGDSSLEIVDKKGIGDFVPASVLNTDVPQVLDAIISKMLAREPKDRYQTASELIVDLERTNLAASVPSFTDPDRAMQDPIVRQRLLAPAMTCPDLRPGIDRPAEDKQIWYLRYKDRHGQPCKAKLTYPQVLRRLKDGTFSLHVEAARFPQGEFQPIASYAEFKEVAPSTRARNYKTPPGDVTREKKNLKSPTKLAWWIALGSGIGATLLLIAGLLFLRQ